MSGGAAKGETTMKLEPNRHYTLIIVSLTEDCDRLDTTTLLRTLIRCVDCRCAWCGRLALRDPTPRVLRAGSTAVVTCLRCLGAAVDQMENIDEPTREHAHALARGFREEMEQRR